MRRKFTLFNVAIVLTICGKCTAEENKPEPVPFPHILEAEYKNDAAEKPKLNAPLSVIAELPETPGNIDVCLDVSTTHCCHHLNGQRVTTHSPHSSCYSSRVAHSSHIILLEALTRVSVRSRSLW